MNIETFRNFCINKKGVTEEFPFDKNTLVYKVMGKMFALTDLDLFTSINLKCVPEVGAELRERYSGCSLVITCLHTEVSVFRHAGMHKKTLDYGAYGWLNSR